MEPWLTLDAENFDKLLRQELPDCDTGPVPRDAKALRFVEIEGGSRTGRWVITAIEWRGDKLWIGWPPLAGRYS
jgi:hypothetical protein